MIVSHACRVGGCVLEAPGFPPARRGGAQWAGLPLSLSE